jgi:hypothetical protein
VLVHSSWPDSTNQVSDVPGAVQRMVFDRIRNLFGWRGMRFNVGETDG